MEKQGYSFDQIVPRNTPEDIKYSNPEGIPDLIPMWVADMDLKCPEEVSKVLVEQSERGIFGYSEADESYDQAMVSWFKKRYDWDVDPKTVLKLPGVVLAISLAVRALTREGDAVLIFEPLYAPIARAIKGNNRKLIISELVLKGSRYEIDFDDMERKIRENSVKMLVFCSPHNPVGRVWTREELQKVGDICVKNDMIIVSDEIHADFVYGGKRNIPIASISDEIGRRTITCTSPTKTFNLAGIQAANLVVPDDEMRLKIDKLSLITGAFGLNVMGIVSTRAAYEHGEEWLDSLLEYLEGNIALVRERLSGTNLKVTDIEGTYLLWIDASCLKTDDPAGFIKKNARVWVSEGTFFGAGGKDYIRLNVACPRSVVDEALNRILELPGVR